MKSVNFVLLKIELDDRTGSFRLDEKILKEIIDRFSIPLLDKPIHLVVANECSYYTRSDGSAEITIDGETTQYDEFPKNYIVLQPFTDNPQFDSYRNAALFLYDYIDIIIKDRLSNYFEIEGAQTFIFDQNAFGLLIAARVYEIYDVPNFENDIYMEEALWKFIAALAGLRDISLSEIMNRFSNESIKSDGGAYITYPKFFEWMCEETINDYMQKLGSSPNIESLDKIKDMLIQTLGVIKEETSDYRDILNDAIEDMLDMIQEDKSLKSFEYFLEQSESRSIIGVIMRPADVLPRLCDCFEKLGTNYALLNKLEHSSAAYLYMFLTMSDYIDALSLSSECIGQGHSIYENTVKFLGVDDAALLSKIESIPDLEQNAYTKIEALSQKYLHLISNNLGQLILTYSNELEKTAKLLSSFDKFEDTKEIYNFLLKFYEKQDNVEKFMEIKALLEGMKDPGDLEI